MKRSTEMCGVVVLCVAVTACSSLPSSRDATSGAPVPRPESEIVALEAEQGDAETGDQDSLGSPLPDATVQGDVKRENLTCFAGNQDRHARIGVELVNNQVNYFAFYSKARPRTCSLEAGRGDAFSRWTDNGAYYTVTLVDRKGKLLIEQRDGAYRFAFVDVDRGRYCGMDGKINGTLTVKRGKRSCEVRGIMDGHSL